MNSEERKQYNQLSAEAKKEYDHIAQSHPEWSHNQIMTKLSVSMSLDDLVNKGGEDVNPKDPNFLLLVLQKARTWLGKFRTMAEGVLDAFDAVITTLKTAITMGLDNLIKSIQERVMQMLK